MDGAVEAENLLEEYTSQKPNKLCRTGEKEFTKQKVKNSLLEVSISTPGVRGIT